MKFLAIYTPANRTPGPPNAEHTARMDEFAQDETKAGVFVTGGAFVPTSTRVSYAGGEVTVMDGPFAESKEVIAGFAILEVGSKEEAIAASRRFLAVAGDGVSELRQIMG
jgi:hypothetical protein